MLVAAGAIGLAWCHRVPRAAAPVAAHPLPVVVEKPRVIARVAGREITNVGLARYQLVKQLSLGVTGERQALDELCDRSLLLEAAREQHLDVSTAELEGEVFRIQVVIGSVAAAAPSSPRTAWASPPVPIFDAPRAPAAVRRPVPGSPLDRAAELLAQSGITREDLVEEMRADLLATKAARKLVYDAIDVPRNELLAAAPRSPLPDAATLDTIHRLQRKRGAKALAALLTELRSRFKVEILN